jgi:type 1 glutamine amidotransferase
LLSLEGSAILQTIRQHGILLVSEMIRMDFGIRMLLLTAGCLSLCGDLALAQAEHSGIWDATIMAQPFDREPFRQIKVPKWVSETIGCGYTLSVMDGKARAAAAAHGVTISEMGFVDPFYAYYDSRLLKKRSPHVPLDRLPKDIAEYQRLGVRVLGVYPPCLQGEVYEDHRDWRRIASNTTDIPQIDMQAFPHGGMLCLLGPYGDFFIDVLAEILEIFPAVDAFSFDGLHYGGVCYCQHCRANYRKETGAEIPATDMNDSAFRRYQYWADRRMENLVQRMQMRLKGIKPDVALVTWTTNAGRFGHFLSIPRNMPARMNLLLDAPDQEFWLDETNRGTTIVPAFANAYIWATTNHRTAFSEPYILSHGNPYGKDSFPPQEIMRRMMLALTYGAAPSIAVAQPANLQQELYACLDEVQRRKAWLTDKSPEPWGALLMSDNTRNFYGRAAGLVEERYMSAVLGTFRMAVEEHLPITVVNDWNLNSADLARYKVLILPNAACLDDAQVAAVREFVRSGGGLVASLDASLFDEFGNPQEQFALGDVFGVDYRGIPQATADVKEELDVNFAQAIGPDYWEKRKNVFDFKQDPGSILNQGRMKTYVGKNMVTFKGPAVRVTPHGGHVQTIATMQAKSVAGAPFMPAVITNTFGRGRVAYFSAGLDAAYYLYAYPYQRLALKHAVEWAASTPAPVRIDAPMCVHSTVMRQTKRNADGVDRLIVHLFNDLNTTAHHALPADDVPLREETVPIRDIRITFDPCYRFRRVHVEPQGLNLELQPNASGTTIVVPQLDVHSMVIGELDEAIAKDRSK